MLPVGWLWVLIFLTAVGTIIVAAIRERRVRTTLPPPDPADPLDDLDEMFNEPGDSPEDYA